MKERICKLCGHKENEHNENGCCKIVSEIPISPFVNVIEVCQCKVMINEPKETKEKDAKHEKHLYKMWVRSILYQDG